MKIKNTLCLHILMATLAILFLSVPPLVKSVDPALTFQPMINTMEGTAKEQKEKIATISHALQGNAIFFLGASEVSTSEDEHYAVYNYFNNQLHRPVVAYGDSYVDSVTHFYCFHVLKMSLTLTVKLFCCWHPIAFIQTVFPGNFCQ